MVDEGAELTSALDGSRLVLGRALGRGGEGTVFVAQDRDRPGQRIAVKWYHPNLGTPSQRRRLENLVAVGAPNHRFLWPDALVVSDEDPNGLGYVMPLRPDDFLGLDALIAGDAGLMSFATLATVGRNLADSFHALHAEGLCYRDIKDANVFVRPEDGEVLVCDNDNVSVDGGDNVGIRGSLYFMAPEVMLGDAYPSLHSDLFSLAVLLFYLLAHHHPLEGRLTLRGMWDLEAQMVALARQPLFIFDPHDPSNAPDPETQSPPLQWWPLLPGFIRDLFTRTFTEGLNDPGARVTETVWRDALDDMRASEVRCICGTINLRDPALTSQRCWSPDCSVPLAEIPTMLPARPRGRRPFQLNTGAVLTEVNASRALGADHSWPVALVETNPTDPQVRGLRNMSTQAWTFRDDRGSSLPVVEPGRALLVREGTLDFGNGYSARLHLPS